jgi:hypothetical protein
MRVFPSTQTESPFLCLPCPMHPEGQAGGGPPSKADGRGSLAIWPCPKL